MKKFPFTYKKAISIACLGAYLLVTGYSLFHVHKTNYFLEESINVEGKVYLSSSFHQNGFCQLFHYSNNQLSGYYHLIPDFTPSELFVNLNSLSLSLISPEINFLLRRGPPSPYKY